MTGLALHEMYYITFAVLRLLGVCPAVRATLQVTPCHGTVPTCTARCRRPWVLDNITKDYMHAMIAPSQQLLLVTSV